MISIIIPTLNEEKAIGNTIQYLRSKITVPHEIIISDGQSTDKTVEIARKYADKVVVYSGTERQTISQGRNAGADVAIGDIILQTDADVIIPNVDKFFPKVLEIFENPLVMGAMTPLRIYPDEEILSDKIFHFISNASIRLANHFGSFLSKGECQFVRTSAFRSIGGYDTNVVVGEDCDLFYRLAKIGKIIYINDLVVYHSPRRFRKTGYIRLLWMYAKEGYSLLFFGKSHLKEWKPER